MFPPEGERMMRKLWKLIYNPLTEDLDYVIAISVALIKEWTRLIKLCQDVKSWRRKLDKPYVTHLLKAAEVI